MKISYACYGGVDSTNTFKIKDVTAQLQALLDGGTTLIKPTMFTDPFFGVHKGFYAQGTFSDGSPVVYLCTDNGQVIDFSRRSAPVAPSAAVAPTGTITVNKAWYGTSVPSYSGNAQNQQDVTGALQTMVNQNPTAAPITSLPDPAWGHHKALCVDLSVNGARRVALMSDYTSWPVDFTKTPSAPSWKSALALNKLSLVYYGRPTSRSNYVFSKCKFDITNTALVAYPRNAQVNGAVSVDFYASTTNTATTLSSMTKIGDFAAQLGSPPLAASDSKTFDLSTYDLNGVTKDLFIPGRLTSGQYYVYAFVRNDDNLLTGMFSSTAYQLPPT